MARSPWPHMTVTGPSGTLGGCGRAPSSTCVGAGEVPGGVLVGLADVEHRAVIGRAPPAGGGEGRPPAVPGRHAAGQLADDVARGRC